MVFSPGQPPPPPHARPPRRVPLLFVGLAAVVGVVLVAVVVGAVLVLKANLGDPGEKVPQPHRVTAKDGVPHWIALSEDWTTEDDAESLDSTGIAADGKRFVTARLPLRVSLSKTAEITGYDGATGKRLWRIRMPWAAEADPVAGNGVVVVPGPYDRSDPERIDYVALDTATGKERWRIRGRAAPDRPAIRKSGRQQPAGAMLNGVFYYADGHTIAGVDATTGKTRYRLTSRRYAGVTGPVAVGGRIGVLASPSAAGADMALLLLPPDLRAYRPVPLPGSAGGDLSRAAASGGDLAVWNDDRFWTVDTRTRRCLVRGVALPGYHQIQGVAGRTVLVGGQYRYEHDLFGYDLRTGRRTWTRGDDGKAGAADRFDVQDGTVFGIGGTISIVDPADGGTVFQRPAYGPSGRHGGSLTTRSGGLTVAAAGHLVVYNGFGLAGYR